MKKHKPWNKWKIVGSKPALTAQQVQIIKSVLAEKESLRNQLLFSLAIDSSLRWADLVTLRVADVMLHWKTLDKIRIIPSKTKNSSGKAIVFEATPYTANLLERYVIETKKLAHEYLFTREDKDFTNKHVSTHILTQSYAWLVKRWIAYAGLEPMLYGTQSLRRTRPAHIYAITGNLRACQIMLGHTSISTTQVYLWIEESETLDIARQFPL